MSLPTIALLQGAQSLLQDARIGGQHSIGAAVLAVHLGNLGEELRGRDYDGVHDSVHRFVKPWREDRARTAAQAFILLRFDPGEAYHFDWSHEDIEFAGLPLTVRVAQMRLAYRRPLENAG